MLVNVASEINMLQIIYSIISCYSELLLCIAKTTCSSTQNDRGNADMLGMCRSLISAATQYMMRRQ